eukprot:12996423-Alexandrium_andersonii.AAC.1
MLWMLSMLLAPARRIASEHPTATLSLFADDRTAVADTDAEMESIKQIWALLERVACLRNNASKQKDWSYAPPPRDGPAAFHGEAPT